VVEAVLEEVDDLLVGDVDYGGALVEEAAHVLAWSDPCEYPISPWSPRSCW
jgi:hypothetical protein